MAEPVFFSPARAISVGEAAAMIDGILLDPSTASRRIDGLAVAGEGGGGKLVFVDGKRNAAMMTGLSAAAVLCQPEIASLAPPGVAVITTKSPALAFARIGRELFPRATYPAAVTAETGVSEHAHVAEDALIEDGAIVEHGAVVGPRAEIGRDAVIGPGAIVGPDCRIGRQARIGANASILASLIGDRVVVHPGARIGQDGFRFIPGPSGLEKVPQIGRVIIQADVEIGANTTIDRGGLGDTVIGEGTKIDNQVQVGHNVRIGRHCAIAAHVGISGSVTLGDFVMLGGRVGISDHVAIGDRVQIAAGSGVMHDVPAGQKWAGFPAKLATDFFRETNVIKKLAADTRRKGPGT